MCSLNQAKTYLPCIKFQGLFEIAAKIFSRVFLFCFVLFCFLVLCLVFEEGAIAASKCQISVYKILKYISI